MCFPLCSVEEKIVATFFIYINLDKCSSPFLFIIIITVVIFRWVRGYAGKRISVCLLTCTYLPNGTK